MKLCWFRLMDRYPTPYISDIWCVEVNGKHPPLDDKRLPLWVWRLWRQVNPTYKDDPS